MAQSDEAVGKPVMIINEQCSACHSTAKIDKKKASLMLSDGKKTIERMIKKGAKINSEQKKIIIDYFFNFNKK